MPNGRWPRRLFHLLGGSLFPIAALFLPQYLILLGVGGASLLAIGGEALRIGYPPFNRWLRHHFGILLKPQEHYEVTGATYLLIGSLLNFVLFPQSIALSALLFLALGDPAAATVGERCGSVRIGRGKGLQGSLAFALAGLGLGLTLRSFTGLSWPVIVVGVLSATAAELATPGRYDNLAIPLTSAMSMTLVGGFFPR